MVGWHQQLTGHEFEQALGHGGQGSLVCYSPWALKESATTEQLDNNNSNDQGDSHVVLSTFTSRSAGNLSDTNWAQHI